MLLSNAKFKWLALGLMPELGQGCVHWEKREVSRSLVLLFGIRLLECKIRRQAQGRKLVLRWNLSLSESGLREGECRSYRGEKKCQLMGMAGWDSARRESVTLWILFGVVGSLCSNPSHQNVGGTLFGGLIELNLWCCGGKQGGMGEDPTVGQLEQLFPEVITAARGTTMGKTNATS